MPSISMPGCVVYICRISSTSCFSMPLRFAICSTGLLAFISLMTPFITLSSSAFINTFKHLFLHYFLHYSYYTVEEHQRQFDKFATLWAEGAYERGKKVTMAGAYLHAFWRFVRDYILKAGFLDGRYGWIIAKINADNVLQKYKKTIALYKQA